MNEVLIKSLLIKQLQGRDYNQIIKIIYAVFYKQYATGFNSAQDKGIVKKMLIMVMFTTDKRKPPAGMIYWFSIFCCAMNRAATILFPEDDWLMAS
jgi:hypothetical protein